MAMEFASPVKNMAAEELGLLLRGNRLRGNGTSISPSRSGSAPPSMEGSFAAIGNLFAKQNAGMDQSLANLHSAIETCDSEEQLLSDPAYIAYYYSHVNLNPRLPPPLISRENRHLVNHVAFGNNRRSLDDGGQKSSHLSVGSMFTHTEDPEDDKSPLPASSDSLEGAITYSDQELRSSSGRHKSLVDLIQEDFPRTPSPVFQFRSSSHGEETVDRDVHAALLNISSVGISEVSESSLGTVNASTEASADDSHVIGLMSADDLSQSFSGLSNSIGKLTITEADEFITKEAEFRSEALRAGLDAPATSNSNATNRADQQMFGRSLQLHHTAVQHLPQSPVVQSQVFFPGTSHPHAHMDRFPLGNPKSSIEGQSGIHSAGLAPPLYATAAAYMGSNTFYPNLQPPNLYAPQYGLSGFAVGSTILPPYVAAYQQHGAFPVSFDPTSGPSFSGRAPVGSVSTGQGVAGVGDLQHVGKFYGQHAMAYQPSFVDPLHVPYYPHTVDNGFGASTHLGRLARGGIGGHINSFVSQNDAHVAHHMGDQKFQFSSVGNMGITTPRKEDIVSSNFYGSSPPMGVMTQFPGSPVASPVMPSSPSGGMSYMGHRNDMRFGQGSPRNGGMYSPWQGPRAVNNFDDPKRNSFLEELKSNNSRKFELSDIAGRIVEFSVDQHGSRFIQQKLENCTAEEKAAVFKEVLPHAPKLMTDVFGNYVIQKFFEYGSAEQRKELADQLTGQMLPLSLQMYGCRVIQKALDVIELDQKTQLVHELDGNVMRCVRDQNGNHVIQKCIEGLPTDRIGFIILAFRGQVAILSTHPYGCRVIQRVLEHCSDQLQSQCIVDEILESSCLLAEDQYGNYVTQHVLERGRPQERGQIISKITGKVVQMSQHKYASNVVEKCLEHGDATERALLIEEIIGQPEENDNLLAMMKDQYANYVVQKILDVGSEKHRAILLDRIKVHLNALKKYTYGKHIVARFEQLTEEDGKSVEANSA